MKQTEVANSSKTIHDISISGSHHNTANGLHFFFFSLSSLKTLRSSTLFFFSFLLGLDSGEGVGRGSFSFGICHARWSETIVKKWGKGNENAVCMTEKWAAKKVSPIVLAFRLKKLSVSFFPCLCRLWLCSMLCRFAERSCVFDRIIYGKQGKKCPIKFWKFVETTNSSKSTTKRKKKEGQRKLSHFWRASYYLNNSFFFLVWRNQKKWKQKKNNEKNEGGSKKTTTKVL